MSDDLTPTEERIIQLVSDGFKDREIADRASLTERNVKYHLNRIYSKLEIEDPDGKTVNRRVVLARWWWSREGRPTIPESPRAAQLLVTLEEMSTVLAHTDERLKLIETLLQGALRNTRHTTVKVERALIEVHALVEGVELVSEAA